MTDTEIEAQYLEIRKKSLDREIEARHDDEKDTSWEIANRSVWLTVSDEDLLRYMVPPEQESYPSRNARREFRRRRRAIKQLQRRLFGKQLAFVEKGNWALRVASKSPPGSKFKLITSR